MPPPPTHCQTATGTLAILEDQFPTSSSQPLDSLLPLPDHSLSKYDISLNTHSHDCDKICRVVAKNFASAQPR